MGCARGIRSGLLLVKPAHVFGSSQQPYYSHLVGHSGQHDVIGLEEVSHFFDSCLVHDTISFCSHHQPSIQPAVQGNGMSWNTDYDSR